MRTDKSSDRGFSLIEILIVIVIIGLLSAIGLPVMIKSIQQAKIHKAKTEMKAMELAFKAYYNQYNEWRPGLSSGDVDMNIVDMLWGGNPNNMNPGKMTFFDFHERDLSSKGFLDPWGRPFKYSVDTNYDGYTAAGSKTIRRIVTLWSEGPDPVLANDDLASWELVYVERSRS